MADDLNMIHNFQKLLKMAYLYQFYQICKVFDILLLTLLFCSPFCAKCLLSNAIRSLGFIDNILSKYIIDPV